MRRLELSNEPLADAQQRRQLLRELQHRRVVHRTLAEQRCETGPRTFIDRRADIERQMALLLQARDHVLDARGFHRAGEGFAGGAQGFVAEQWHESGLA